MHPSFLVEGPSSAGGRKGILSADGWMLRTPAVVPVGPLATAGSLTAEDLAACGVRALGVDWLRLWLRPGIERLGALGGLRRSLGWPGAVLPGSAAWVFGNAGARVREAEARLVSPDDGSTHRLTPETAVEAQVALGLEVVAVLNWPDVAARGTEDVAGLRLAWAAATLAAAGSRAFALASLPLGSPVELASELGRLPFRGYVLEGLDLLSDWRAALDRALSALPESALRVVDWHGGISGLREIVAAGVDEVRLPGEAERAREGVVLTDEGSTSALSDSWLDDPRPPVEGCDCPTCRRFSRAYVRHLFAARELLGPRLVEAHNLASLARI